MVDDVARNGQPIDVEEHHARQCVADDVVNLIVGDRPVITADATAATQTKPDGRIGRILNQVVANRQVVIGVGCRLTANCRCSAVEGHAIYRDTVGGDGDVARQRTLSTASAAAGDPSVRTEDRQGLVDGDIFGISTSRHNHGVTRTRCVNRRLDRGKTATPHEQELAGFGTIKDLNIDQLIRAFGGTCGHLPEIWLFTDHLFRQ